MSTLTTDQSPKRRGFAALAALACAALLAACDAPSNPDVLAGVNSVPAANAGGLFQQVCVNNRRNLEQARPVLAGLPFTRNSTQDIYYHNTLNLSFKLTPEGGGILCSMVWFPVESNATHQATINAIAPDAALRENDNGLLSAFLLGL